jgi:hypothetical protein
VSERLAAQDDAHAELAFVASHPKLKLAARPVSYGLGVPGSTRLLGPGTGPGQLSHEVIRSRDGLPEGVATSRVEIQQDGGGSNYG